MIFICPQPGTKKSSHKRMPACILFFPYDQADGQATIKRPQATSDGSTWLSLFSLRIIKFTTCLALKVLNAFTFHSLSLQEFLYSLSGNLLHKICSISDIYHCNCHTNMPILPGRLSSFLPHPIFWALYPHLYSLRQQIMISTPEFTSPFTSHLQAF